MNGSVGKCGDQDTFAQFEAFCDNLGKHPRLAGSWRALDQAWRRKLCFYLALFQCPNTEETI